MRYILPHCRTDVNFHSFFLSGIRLWNGLPIDMITAQILDAFKKGLDKKNNNKGDTLKIEKIKSFLTMSQRSVKEKEKMNQFIKLYKKIEKLLDHLPYHQL